MRVSRRYMVCLAAAVPISLEVAICSIGSADNAVALCHRAKALKDAGQFEAAVAAYQEALKADPHSAEAYWGLAWIYRKQGLREPAIEAFRRVLSLTNNEQQAQEAREALQRMGVPVVETESSPVSSAGGPEPDPTLAGAREWLARGRVTEAVRLLRRLIAEDDNAEEARVLLEEVKRGRRLVRVRAVADPVFRSLPDWQSRLQARFQVAASHLSRQVPIDFALVAIGAWEPGASLEDGGLALIRDLQQAVSDDDVDIVVGFVAQRVEAPPDGSRLEIKGYTLGLAPCFTGTIIVVEPVAAAGGREWRVQEERLQENLAHELAHLFGAVHVEGNSLMRAGPSGTPILDLDPLNLEVLEACRWVDFRDHFASLSDQELQRLIAAYDRLAAGPAADDGVHFYRAVALTFLGRYEDAIAAYRRVLETSWADAHAHLNLASLYEQVGDIAMARTHWRLAAALGHLPEIVHAAEQGLRRTEDFERHPPRRGG